MMSQAKFDKYKTILVILGFIVFYFSYAFAASSGNYQGQAWSIDEKHRLIWEGVPYIPYMTLSGMKYLAPNAQEELKEQQQKINQWASKGIKEYWLWFGFGKEQPSFTYYPFFDVLTNTIIKNGGTYSIQVFANEYLHSKAIQSTLQPKDKAPFFIRAVKDVTPYSGKTLALPSQDVSFAKTKVDLTWLVYSKESQEDYFETTGISFQNEVEAYLVDFDTNTYKNISSTVKSANYDDRNAKVTVNFSKINFPDSLGQKLIILAKLYLTQLKAPGGAMELVYMDKILQTERGFYKKYAKALAKKQLRLVNINNEIDRIEENFCFFSDRRSRLPGQEKSLGIEFPDFSYDMVNYRNWLTSKYSSIENFNNAMGTNYASFSEVEWFKPIVFDKKKLLGIFTDLNQALAFEDLQRQYFTYKLGKGMADAAKIIKEEWGDVPVCIASTSSYDLDLQEAALEAGIDGLCGHYYGSLTQIMDVEGESWNIKTRRDFPNALNILNKQTTNKLYWVTEFNEIQEIESAPAGPFQRFTNKEDMKTFIKILTDNGAQGFLFFEGIGRPPSRAALNELWGWYAELKDEAIKSVQGYKEDAMAKPILKEKQVLEEKQRAEKQIPPEKANILLNRYWIRAVQEIDKRQSQGQDISKYSRLLKKARQEKENGNIDRALESLKELIRELGLPETFEIKEEEER